MDVVLYEYCSPFSTLEKYAHTHTHTKHWIIAKMCLSLFKGEALYLWVDKSQAILSYDTINGGAQPNLHGLANRRWF